MHESILELISKVNNSEMNYDLKQHLIAYITTREKQLEQYVKYIKKLKGK